MGTRAAFFVGDPRNENSRWLGCVAWDGHLENFLPGFKPATNAEEFVKLVYETIADRDDFADPTKHGWPFPWNDNVFLTDCCYWWDDGVKWSLFHHGPFTLEEWTANQEPPMSDDLDDLIDKHPDRSLPNNVNIGLPYDRSAPDSVMILRYR